MSAFLGPIHFWLYRKIILQQDLADYILNNSNVADKNEIFTEAVNSFGRPETREFETVIDEGNIHGWLQQQVSCAENRLAFFVTMILKESQDSLDALLQSARSFGEKNKINYTDSPIEAWREIDERLLSGMPCDHVNEVTVQSDTILEYTVTADIHEKYWLQNNGDIENYYLIVEAFIEGMLSDCPLNYTKVQDRQYRISGKVVG